MKNFIEWKKNYSYLVKHYPDITSLYDVSETFTLFKTIYIKRGNKWIVESDVIQQNIDVEFYLNTFEAIPLFRAIGGYEKAETKYTRFGKIPFKVTSISPDRQKKIVYEMCF